MSTRTNEGGGLVDYVEYIYGRAYRYRNIEPRSRLDTRSGVVGTKDVGTVLNSGV